MQAIEVKNLKKTYRVKKTIIQALNNVDLRIKEGEMIAIMGESGSGKSTLLNIIGGLERPDEGVVTIFNQNINDFSDTQLAEYRNKTIGFVFQFFHLQPFLTVEKNIRVPLLFSKEKIDYKSRINEVLEAVHMSDRAQHLPSQLSGGQMQRAAIARALVMNPKIILADEPTGNLDKKNGEQVLQLMREINQKNRTTFIIVTHDDRVAKEADRVISLKQGEII